MKRCNETGMNTVIRSGSLTHWMKVTLFYGAEFITLVLITAIMPLINIYKCYYSP